MAKKTRMDELFDLDVDYSNPIDAFAQKARTLFNKSAKAAGIKTRVHAGEYSDGAARLYLNNMDDDLGAFGGVISVYSLNVQLLASSNAKLKKIDLPVTRVAFSGDEINVEFCG